MDARAGNLTSAPASSTQPLIAVPALFAAPLSARTRLVSLLVFAKDLTALD